jgi:hypothetical protein
MSGEISGPPAIRVGYGHPRANRARDHRRALALGSGGQEIGMALVEPTDRLAQLIDGVGLDRSRLPNASTSTTVIVSMS